MPSQIYTFNTAQDVLHMMWKEQYVTEGINQRDIAVKAKGTYRGFRLSTTISTTNLTVTADPVQNDHVAVVYDNTNTYALELRRLGGSFTVSLASYCNATYANQTLYITLAGAYTPGSTTAVYLQVYTATEFAAAPEASYLTVLGTVVIGGSAPYYPSSISIVGRTEAWSGIAPENTPWTPLLVNGGFDRGPTGALTLTNFGTFSANNFQLPGWNVNLISGTGSWALQTTTINPNPGPNLFPGTQALQFSNSAGANSAHLTQYLNVPISTGQQIFVRMWINCPQGAPTGGTIQVTLIGANTSGTLVGFNTITLPSSVLTTSWTEYTTTVTIPSATPPWVVLNAFRVELNSATFTSTGAALILDDVQVWAETNSPLAPNYNRDCRQVDLGPGDLILTDPISNSASSDFATATVAGVLHFDTTSSSAPAGGQLILERRDQSSAAASAQPFANFKGQVIVGQNLLGSITNDDTARLELPTDTTSETTLTLIMESKSASFANNAGMTATRMYVAGNGDTWLTNNAFYTNGNASPWSFDDNTTANQVYAVRISAETGSMQILGNPSISPWTTAEWTSLGNIDPGGNWTFNGTGSFGGSLIKLDGLNKAAASVTGAGFTPLAPSSVGFASGTTAFSVSFTHTGMYLVGIYLNNPTAASITVSQLELGTATGDGFGTTTAGFTLYGTGGLYGASFTLTGTGTPATSSAAFCVPFYASGGINLSITTSATGLNGLVTYTLL